MVPPRRNRPLPAAAVVDVSRLTSCSQWGCRWCQPTDRKCQWVPWTPNRGVPESACRGGRLQRHQGTQDRRERQPGGPRGRPGRVDRGNRIPCRWEQGHDPCSSTPPKCCAGPANVPATTWRTSRNACHSFRPGFDMKAADTEVAGKADQRYAYTTRIPVPPGAPRRTPSGSRLSHCGRDCARQAVSQPARHALHDATPGGVVAGIPR